MKFKAEYEERSCILSAFLVLKDVRRDRMRLSVGIKNHRTLKNGRGTETPFPFFRVLLFLIHRICARFTQDLPIDLRKT